MYRPGFAVYIKLATMRYEATLHYSASLLRQAVFAFWRRTVGVGFLVALVIVAASLAALFQQGDRTWMVGALAMVLLFGLAFLVAIYVAHLRNSMQKFRAMGSPHAVFVAEDSSFTVTSGIGSSKLAWSAVSEVWRYPSFWLILFSKSQFLTLPLAGIPEEMQSFILQRVKASGGKGGD